MAELARSPPEVWPLAHYIAEEMAARGWTTDDVARRMGGDFGMNALVLGMLLCVQDDNLLVGDELFGQLAFAFDVSEELFRNLDAVWRAADPSRRVEFNLDEALIGPAGIGSPPAGPN